MNNPTIIKWYFTTGGVDWLLPGTLKEVATFMNTGYTLYKTQGGWKDNANKLVQEDSYVLEIVIDNSKELEYKVKVICQFLCKEFNQEEVLAYLIPAYSKIVTRRRVTVSTKDLDAEPASWPSGS